MIGRGYKWGFGDSGNFFSLFRWWLPRCVHLVVIILFTLFYDNKSVIPNEKSGSLC